MAMTKFADMQIVPEKFTEYTLDTTTSKSTLVNRGIAVGNPLVAGAINSTPQGSPYVLMPKFNALDENESDEIFGETAMVPTNISTGVERAALLIRQKAWGSTDLARVKGGADPIGAISNLLADWWVAREQKIYLSILKGLLDPTAGALKSHVNDISAATGAASLITDGTTLDTKQTLGDAYDKLGMVFMHSATYTKLQKDLKIITTYDPRQDINIQTYLGFEVVVDDSMPVNSGVYDTYFLGVGAFVREDGMPDGLVGTETDRDTLGSSDVLVNRRAMVLHPKGVSFIGESFIVPTNAYAANDDLAKADNWKLVSDHKKVPIACLRHKLA